MGSFTGLSDLVNRLTGGNSGSPEFLFWWKTSNVGGAAASATSSRWSSLWQYDGSPSGGNAPGAVAAPTNATSGSLKQTDPGGGRQKYFIGATTGPSIAGTLMIYDRLLHISGMSGTNTGAQTVGGSLTRYTSGVGNQIWMEVYTQIGASATTVTASYSNTTPTSGRTTQPVAFGGSQLREAQRMVPLSLQSGDTGVSAVASITLNATTGTAGDFGVTVVHPIMMISETISGGGGLIDGITVLPTLPEIKTGACLALAFYPASSFAPSMMSSFTFVEV